MAGTTPVRPTSSNPLRASFRAGALAVLALALLASCGPPAPHWRAVFTDPLPAALLSIWGSSARDVWAVGGDPGDGPYVIHFDGAAWRRVPTGTRGALWWVHGFPDGVIFMGGERGTILRYQGGTFTPMTTPSASPTVFGIWGPSSNDVFAVGGLFTGAGFVWHWDGTAWSPVTLPTFPPGLVMPSIFKVWGTSSTDAWFCGTGGVIMHWDGTALALEPASGAETLFTVHVAGGQVAAVGGLGSGSLLERSASGAWTDVAPDAIPQLNGIWLTGDGGGLAVGNDTAVAVRHGGVWTREETGLFVRDLHSAWIDPDGGRWAVGGDLADPALSAGAVVYDGPGSIGPGTLGM